METRGTLSVTSAVFRDGQTIPQSAVFSGMGCTGDNQSPDLTWSGAPDGTRSYAITIWDPDAPTGVGFVHWVLFNIPASTTALPAGAGGHKHAGVGATHGFTDFGENRYGGPCPPPGDPPHHYHLTVYALDVERLEGLDETTTYAKFRFVVRAHTLASAEVVGLYGRPAQP
ncbi:MAG: YbhB/YbcL family Raf kinase inhibitor-like protein [Candidatus Eremiobacteraeota bacterium]|nr:YbhB/YbcL family Raf kinase inhibitor-like protein [Candidatus Eremiobacteraeota bacterium]